MRPEKDRCVRLDTQTFKWDRRGALCRELGSHPKSCKTVKSENECQTLLYYYVISSNFTLKSSTQQYFEVFFIWKSRKKDKFALTDGNKASGCVFSSHLFL